MGEHDYDLRLKGLIFIAIFLGAPTALMVWNKTLGTLTNEEDCVTCLSMANAMRNANSPHECQAHEWMKSKGMIV